MCVGEPRADGAVETIALGDATSRTVWRIAWSPPTFTWSSERVPPTDRETWHSDVAEWAPRTRAADVRVSGSAEQLYFAVYGRMTGVPAPQIDGDVELWARWQAASAL